MLIRTRILLTLNKLFRCPVHPFNLQNDGKTSYAMWQYEKGADTIKNYAEKVDAETMFSGKDVLDIGCGAAGKSMYYASLGAKSVTGMDVVPYYEEEATALAESLGFSDVFRFVLGDAAHMDFPDESFDVIIMNDAMEHVDDPMGVLNEAARVLKKGGRLYLNFPLPLKKSTQPLYNNANHAPIVVINDFLHRILQFHLAFIVHHGNLITNAIFHQLTN